MRDTPVIRSCTDAQEWDAFVDYVPWATPQHVFAWGRELERCFGYLQQAYKLFLIKDCVVAALPLIRLSGGWPFRSLHSLVFDSYGGPLIHPDYLVDENLLRVISDAIDSEASRYHAFEAKLVTPPLVPEAVIQCLQTKESVIYFQRNSLFLSLDKPLERITAGYSTSVQRAIRRSAREDVVIQDNPELEEVREAYPIYRRTMNRLGGTSKPWRFIEALLRNELAVAFLARHNTNLIGIIILLVSRRMATYWIAAADPSASQLRPTNAMVDHAIRWCHNRGIGLFSFGESPQDRPGLVRFKKGWGTETAQSITVLRIYRPHVRRMWITLEPTMRRYYALWDQFRHGVS